jgi:hypothetical protein
MRSQMFSQRMPVNPAVFPADPSPRRPMCADPSPRRPMCLDVTGRLLARGGGGQARSHEAICMTGKRVLISRNKGGKA